MKKSLSLHSLLSATLRTTKRPQPATQQRREAESDRKDCGASDPGWNLDPDSDPQSNID